MKRAASPSSWVLLTACFVLFAGQGCKPNTRDNPKACGFSDDDLCAPGLSCDRPTHTCVPADGGAAGQGVAGGDGSGGTSVGPGGGGDAGNGTAGGGAGANGGMTGLGGTNADGGMDAPTVHCQGDKDCAGKTGTLACDPTTNTCVECIDPSTCGGTTPICDTTRHACVECTALDSSCTGATPVCNTKTDQCVACLADIQCTAAGATFCGKDNACVGCADAGPDACSTRDPSKPVCGASGDCVQCDTDKDCHGTTPFCGAQKTCVPCMNAPKDACAGLNTGATPVCATSGACVQCGKDADCSPTSTTPFCSDAGTCASCKSAGAQFCMTTTPGTPACSTSGACVECVANSDCPDGKPVCSASNACGACTSDTDCTGRGPGVCMSNLDGRCASSKETIYVQNSSSCSDAGGSSGGTATAPFCSMQAATAAISPSRAVVVVRGTVGGASTGMGTSVSIIGQNSGAILGSVNPALHVTGGTTYARDLKLSTAGSIGCQADTGSNVKLEHVLVTGNSGGGILLNGAGFDIHNVTVTNNGPGTVGSTTWGGIFVNMPPAGGPTSLRQTTVQTNNPVGISCSASIAAVASGVLASGSTSSVDIGPTCGFTSCGPASTTCGAQP